MSDCMDIADLLRLSRERAASPLDADVQKAMLVIVDENPCIMEQASPLNRAIIENYRRVHTPKPKKSRKK